MTDEKIVVPSFYAGFLKLFSGLAFVQLLNFIFSLILPRFYSPSDYALFGIFTSVFLILAEINTLRLDITIFFQKEDLHAIEIVHAVFFVSAIFSMLILIVSIVTSFFYDTSYILISLVLLASGVGQVLSAWFNRKGDYKRLNVYRILQSLISPVLSLVFIITFKWHFGLIMGFVIGQLSAVFYLIIHFGNFNLKLISRRLAVRYIHQYKQFPKFGLFSSLINSASKNSIVIFLKIFFGMLNAGYYTLAIRVLSVPGGVYQSALSQIYLQQASSLDNASLKMYTKKVIWFGFFIGIVPVIVVLFFGQSLFAFIFGSQWHTAGKMAQYIVLWFFFQVLIGPVSFMLDIKQKLKFELGWNIVLFIFRITAVIIAILLNDIYLMLLLLTIVAVLLNLYLLRYVLRLTDD